MADARELKIRVLLDAVDRVTRPLREMARGSKDAAKAVKAARAEVARLGKVDRELQSMKALRTELGVDRTALDGLKGKLAAARGQLEATDRPARTLTAQVKRLTAETKAGDAALEEKNRRLDQLQHGLQRAGMGEQSLAHFESDLARRTREATNALAQQQSRLASLNKAQERSAKMRERGEKLRSGGVKTLATGAALAAPVVAAAKAAIGFEASMANVYKFQQDGARYTAQQKRDLEQNLIGNGVKLGIDAEGMGRIAGQGAAGGIHDLGELKKFAADAAMVKESLNFGSAEEAGEWLSGMRHSTQGAEKDVRELAEVASGLTRKWGAKAGRGAEVGEIFERVGNFGKIAGGGYKETMALASVLSSVNVPASRAATSIRNLYGFLSRGAGASKTQQKAFSALGLSAEQVATDLSQHGAPAIVRVLEALKQLPKERQAGVLGQLFGSRSVGDIGTYVQNLERLKASLAFVADRKNYANAMEEEFAGKTANTAFQMEKAKASAKALAIEIGSGLLPDIDGVVRRVSGLLDKLRDWAQHHRELAHSIALGALIMGGLLAVLGFLALAAGAVLVPLASLNIAFAAGSPLMTAWAAGSSLAGGALAALQGGFLAAAAGALEFGAAMLLNPVTWIIAGVLLLAALAYLVIKNWKPISSFFGRLWDDVKAGVDKVVHWFEGLPDRFRDIGHNIMQGLRAGIMGPGGQVVAGMIDIGGKLVDATKRKLGIHSPSRVFAELGGYVMAGFGQGLRRSERDPLAAILATARKATAALSVVPVIGAGAPVLAAPTAAVAREAAHLLRSPGELAGAAQVMAEPIARTALRPDGSPALTSPRLTPIARGAQGRADVGAPAPATFVFSPTIQGGTMDEAKLMALFDRWTREKERDLAARRASVLADDYEGSGL